MVNIDYIFELLDWNSSIEDKQKGLSLARKVKCITVFLQPGYPYGKNGGENCAIILAEKSDTELERFLSPLMTWLQDLNWPGSDIILYRLQQLTEKTNVYYRIAYHNCTTCAKALNDLVWEENLKKMDAGISWRHKNH